jgi:glycosyltransferase involved in cell wall biosynthesis
MRVLLINKFLYPKGGDAISTLTTGQLLSKKGHEVYFWGMDHPHNPEYPYKEYFVSHVDYNRPQKKSDQLKAAINILYSYEAKNKLEAFINKIKPDIVHLNNFAHQISPSILHVLRKHKIPAVMTMRDYKMVCASYSMFVKVQPCEKCKNGKYYHCILQRCTKGSAVKSAVNTLEMYLHHKILHIYDGINIYISPSKFLKSKVKEMGFQHEVVYLPNFVDVETMQPLYESQEKSIVYIGRLSHEKGIETLLEAVKGVDVKLKIIGDGPLTDSLINKSKKDQIQNVDFMGYMKGEDLHNEIKKSILMVTPSEWYENNPRTVIEAFALGKPVIGARIGGIPELVRDWETGITFEAGNVYDLRDKIQSMLQNRARLPEMGRKARDFVEKELNPETHYRMLMDIYEKTINNSRSAK